MSLKNFESLAEELLVEEGIIKRRSLQRRAVIGCIGCRWLGAEQSGTEPELYIYQISKCTGLSRATVHTIIEPLVDTGIIATERERVTADIPTNPPRKYLYPTDSELGGAFWERLELPETCPLEIDT